MRRSDERPRKTGNSSVKYSDDEDARPRNQLVVDLSNHQQDNIGTVNERVSK